MVDSVFTRIRSLMASLTPSEAKVAEYCLNNPQGILANSIYTVADEAGVSIASVSRLSSALGYRDWKEMRLSLAKDSVSMDNPVYPEISNDDSDDSAIDKVFDGNIMCLRNTYRQLNRADLLRVVEAVAASDRILFFGSGGSGHIAKDEALRFSHLTATTEAGTEDYQMMIQASKMREGQVAFGFSNSGRSRATVNVITEARRRGALTVAITNFSATPLERAAEITFQTAFPRGGGITAALTARVGLLTIMDAIYVLAAQHGSMSPEVEYMNKVLEDNFRVPGRARSGGKRKKSAE
ncbi:MAG: MurR/RpiR family transcriptional regulator [Planctomycetes bacterium]|nr:MurR/RpiR family transcriptional regulator [Planctomycetota bacterium]